MRMRDLRTMKRVRCCVGGAVVGEDDLALDRAVAKELGASPEAFLDATRLVIRGKDEGEDEELSARRTAASEATPVAARSRTATALVALAVPLALGALAGLVVVTVLVHGPDREVHPAHAVDLGDLDLDLVADLDDILDRVHALGRELADPHEAFLPRKVFDERSDAHDPSDLAVVDLADLGLFGEALDHRASPVAPLGLGARDADRTVVLELDRRARFGLDRADHLAAWADDLADLVWLDLDRLD